MINAAARQPVDWRRLSRHHCHCRMPLTTALRGAPASTLRRQAQQPASVHPRPASVVHKLRRHQATRKLTRASAWFAKDKKPAPQPPAPAAEQRVDLLPSLSLVVGILVAVYGIFNMQLQGSLQDLKNDLSRQQATLDRYTGDTAETKGLAKRLDRDVDKLADILALLAARCVLQLCSSCCAALSSC